MIKEWKKIGGGSFRMSSGRIIKPGQVFKADENDIPLSFRNVIIPTDGSKASSIEDTTVPVKVSAPEYKVAPRGDSKVWFDVLNSSGKVLNEKALRKAEAEKLLESL